MFIYRFVTEGYVYAAVSFKGSGWILLPSIYCKCHGSVVTLGHQDPHLLVSTVAIKSGSISTGTPANTINKDGRIENQQGPESQDCYHRMDCCKYCRSIPLKQPMVFCINALEHSKPNAVNSHMHYDYFTQSGGNRHVQYVNINTEI